MALSPTVNKSPAVNKSPGVSKSPGPVTRRQLALSMESEASNPVAVAPPLDLHTTPVRVARKKQAVKKITPRKAKK